MLSEREIIISRTDVFGRIVYANDAFLKASGYSLGELVGEPQNIIRFDLGIICPLRYGTPNMMRLDSAAVRPGRLRRCDRLIP